MQLVIRYPGLSCTCMKILARLLDSSILRPSFSSFAINVAASVTCSFGFRSLDEGSCSVVQSSSAACSAISATTCCDEWQSTPFSLLAFPPPAQNPPCACSSLPGECSLSTHSDPSGVTVPALALSITSARAMSPGSIERCRYAGEITELGPWERYGKVDATEDRNGDGNISESCRSCKPRITVV